MDNQKKIKLWKIPQVSIVLISIVSFFTTGQGMSDTFFQGSIIAAVAVSIVFQLLLAWLNRILPDLLVDKDRKTHIFVWAVYIFIGIWSIGFSFVYLCNHAYDAIYMRDDQDLLSDTYRIEKYNLEERANRDFTEKLQESTNLVGEMLTLIDTVDSESQNSVRAVAPDFQNLKTHFEDNAQMIFVIQKCENASEGKGIGDSPKLEAMIKSALSDVSAEKAELQKEYTDLSNKISDCNERIHELSLDMYPLTVKSRAFKSLEDEKKLVIGERDSLLNKEKELDQDIKSKELAINEINALYNYLLASASSVENVLSAKYSQILAKLSSEKPDIENAMILADDIGLELLSTIQEEGDNKKYIDVIEGNLKLQASIKELSQIRSVQLYCSEESRNNSDICQFTDQWVSSFPTADEKEQWRESWNDEIIAMKSNIYKLPSASDKEVQKTYKQLSDLQRNLLTELNKVERSKYYLFSDHPMLAWIALLLAIVLDTVPVLFMIMRQMTVLPTKTPVPDVIY